MPRTPRLLLLAALAPACVASGELRPFTTDGCSMFPDRSAVSRASWERCCVAHDMWYWRGGAEAERLEADRALRSCVEAETHDPVLAEAMFRGVRAGGSPYSVATYRWGYGWRRDRGYAPLTDGDRRRADELLGEWLRAHADAPRPPWLGAGAGP